jgi:hypothetical protein
MSIWEAWARETLINFIKLKVLKVTINILLKNMSTVEYDLVKLGLIYWGS